jgi:hypothetical protein
LRLSAHVYQVRWDSRRARVLVPARPLTGTAVISPLSARNGMLVSSRADLLRLGGWIRIAAVSAHSIVHIPCGSNPNPYAGWCDASSPVDLVIVRSDTALRPSAWKAVRSQLRHSRPAVLQAPQARPQKPYRHWEWSEQRLIRMTEHAATLVVSAPAWSLLDLGDTVTEAGEQVANSRDIHRHGQAHLVGLAGVLSGGGSNPHEFDIVGSDPLFHKRERTRRHSEQTG